jgi:hypothetical protein
VCVIAGLEHFLGKEEVVVSITILGSISSIIYSHLKLSLTYSPTTVSFGSLGAWLLSPDTKAQ